jgi:hypothetical protein
MYKETELLTFTRRNTPVDTPLCITFSSRDVLLSGSIPSDFLLPILKPKPMTDVQHIGRIVFHLDGFYRRSGLMWSNLAQTARSGLGRAYGSASSEGVSQLDLC